ncbi:MAG: membrane protein insertion efficiency factor YidD [Bacteroidetes bacterium]|jgi:putative membrane protein insertion efficiency factor|nr:membrane protein insertion efficiency factor YidD [Bacteroidota bacterium]
MLRALALLPRRLLIGLVRGYQLIISPHLPRSCRYTPSCSAYAMQALREYGAVKGTILAVWRVLRCNPWGGHGHDPPRWFGEPPPEEMVEPTADDGPQNAANESPNARGSSEEWPASQPAPRNQQPATL